MKKLLLPLLTICVFSCQHKKKELAKREIQSVKIQEFKRDSTSIRAITAISEDTLYYAGSNGDIGFTTNGGKNWNTIKISDSLQKKPHFRSIAINNNNIFALSIENPALLFKIPLEPKTKTRSKTLYELVYSERHEKVFYDCMQFFPNSNHGIAVGDPIDNYPSIIRTSDGGNTWKKIDTTNLPKLKEGEAFFAASNTNIKIINNTVWIVTGGKKARILKSKDKGDTWKVYDTPFIQGESHQGIYSVDFYDSKNGIIVGGSYANPDNNCSNKAITNDGGKTWEIVANNVNPNYKSCVQYIPNTNGKEIIAIGKTGISYSNDSGKNWKELSKESYYSIQFVDKNTAWLSGNKKIGKLKLL